MPVHLYCFGPPKGRQAEGAAAASLSTCEYIMSRVLICAAMITREKPETNFICREAENVQRKEAAVP